jgi:hypothetical protein
VRQEPSDRINNKRNSGALVNAGRGNSTPTGYVATSVYTVIIMWRPARFIRLLIVPDIQLVDDEDQYCARPRRSLMAADPVPVGVSRLEVYNLGGVRSLGDSAILGAEATPGLPSDQSTSSRPFPRVSHHTLPIIMQSWRQPHPRS